MDLSNELNIQIIVWIINNLIRKLKSVYWFDYTHIFLNFSECSMKING